MTRSEGSLEAQSEAPMPIGRRQSKQPVSNDFILIRKLWLIPIASLADKHRLTSNTDAAVPFLDM